MAKPFLQGVWIGFWSAAGFFFVCMSEGFKIIAQFCYALAGKENPDG